MAYKKHGARGIAHRVKDSFVCPAIALLRYALCALPYAVSYWLLIFL
jgi:hypothetical protein